ncbi:MAG TPA: DUF983 domain-containing protein, partial [Aquihabitans sp.]|nr:DUF983 domain-containing protein [Aquihabitans sp.]
PPLAARVGGPLDRAPRCRSRAVAAMMGAMGQPFGVEDVLKGRPAPRTLLRRGISKRCPRCGGGGLFAGYFRMRERCPTCGYQFEREPGFFVGAWFINFGIAEGLLFPIVMLFGWWKNVHPDAGVLGPAILGAAIAIVGPIVFYPFSKTIWSAFDLMMVPLEVSEIVAAADALDDEPAGGRGREDGAVGDEGSEP